MEQDKIVLIVIAVALTALVTSLMLKPGCNQEDACECPPWTYNQSTGLKLIYLMPLGCEDCDLEMVDRISNQLRIPIDKYVTDSVPQPSILILNNNVSTLATAATRYNILSSICETTNHSVACQLINYTNTTSTIECLEKYDIPQNTLIYLHKADLQLCRDIRKWITELEKEDLIFYVISLDNIDRMKIGRECLSELTSFKNLFFPQLICPADGRIKVGPISYSELKKFAADCNKQTTR